MLEKGKQYKDAKALKVHVAALFAGAGRSFHSGNGGGRQKKHICNGAKGRCLAEVRACKQRSGEFKVTFIIPDHNDCSGGKVGARSAALEGFASAAMVSNPTVKGTDLKRSLEQQTGLKVSYSAASRLKVAATRASKEQLEHGYRIMTSYCKELVKDCPGSIAVVQVVFTGLNERLAPPDGVSGPVGLQELTDSMLKMFSQIQVSRIPTMLQQFNVPEGTPFKTWFAEIRRLIEGLRCFGDRCPEESALIACAIECLSIQFPTVAMNFADKLAKITTSRGFFALFKDHTSSAIPAQAPTHVGATPARHSFPTQSKSQQPRVMMVHGGTYDVLDNGTTYEPVDEDDWQEVMEVKTQTPTGKPARGIRLFQYSYNSKEAQEGREKWGQLRR
ncbi:unnamed protein product [Ectocarpus sp. CCAP 1310/34]|nr:unnamed protein product [Ectocarpus sp. CCAP 1310/34]